MDEILHRFQTRRNHCWLAFTGKLSFHGFSGGAGFRSSTVVVKHSRPSTSCSHMSPGRTPEVVNPATGRYTNETVPAHTNKGRTNRAWAPHLLGGKEALRRSQNRPGAPRTWGILLLIGGWANSPPNPGTPPVSLNWG